MKKIRHPYSTRCKHPFCTDCLTKRGRNRGNRNARHLIKQLLRKGKEP